MYITVSQLFVYVLGKIKVNALSDQPVTLTRRLREAPPIKYRDLSSTSLNQT